MKESFVRVFLSLKFKIVLIVLIAALFPSVVFSVCFCYVYRDRCVRSDTNNLISHAEVLASEVASSGYIESQKDQEINIRISELSQIISGRIMLCDSSLRVISDTNKVDEGRIFIWKNVVNALKGEEESFYEKEISNLTVTVPIITKDEKGNNVIIGAIIISQNMTYIDDNMNYLISLSVIFCIMVAIFAIIAGVIVSNKYSNPIKEASKQLEKGSNGNKVEELKKGGFTEFDDLTDEFNSYINKMTAIDESRQEFVSNVSHELKTPLTSMKVLADSLIGMGEAPVELYQEFMSDIAAEIDRETVVINDLLAMVRMDKSNATLSISTVNVNELTETILKRLRPIAEKNKVELVLESYRPISAEVDEVKLSLAISNLIENGIKYNNPGGFVHISLNADHQFFYIRVEDSGMGIPKESLEHIFERFYRVDKSHSREIGGTGLGLAITHMSIIMHHGEIKVDSELGEGTTFDVRIPLSHISKEVLDEETDN